MKKPSLPQGTRDFGPAVVRKRQYILQTIRACFERYGFEPLETPAFENLETLMGKYGDEGDKLIFKILNNGLDRPEKRESTITAFDDVLAGKNNTAITERALRYDLTIPFARYVAMNHGALTMPWRRYQVQPVWRADRPQKGRYREFYQCDADIVGSRSLLCELELLNLYAEAFALLKVPVNICINHRQVLAGLARKCGDEGLLSTLSTAIDKLDKIGLEKVLSELQEKGINNTSVEYVKQYLTLPVNDTLQTALKFFEDDSASIEALQSLLSITGGVNTEYENVSLTYDLTLARGLSYYTGMIVEVKPVGVNMGSIGGGGRYDDLTGLFGVPGVPGIGISFGVDRIYDVMDELQCFPATVNHGTEVLFVNVGGDAQAKSFALMQQMRKAGLRCQIYHETARLDKQFKWADKKQIPLVVILAEDELAKEVVQLKDLRNGRQQTIAHHDLYKALREHLAQ